MSNIGTEPKPVFRSRKVIIKGLLTDAESGKIAKCAQDVYIDY